MNECDLPHKKEKYCRCGIMILNNKGGVEQWVRKKIFDVEGCKTCGHKLCAKKVSLFSNLSDQQIETIISLIERKIIKKVKPFFILVMTLIVYTLLIMAV